MCRVTTTNELTLKIFNKINMDKTMKCITFFVLALTIVCSAAVAFLNFNTHSLPKGNNKTCIKSENGQLKCETSIYLLPEYLDRIISKRYIEAIQQDTERQQQHLNDNKERIKSIIDQSFWEAKPAARLIGKKLHDAVKDDINVTIEPIREWNYGRDEDETKAFLRHGVRYRNGRLVIPVDGTYFVYSLIDFFESCDPSTGIPNVKDLNKPIKHAIYKLSILEEAETEIIVNVQPHQLSSNSLYNSYSSYVSLLASLKAGDEISVKVSNITYLRHVIDNNFGLNLIKLTRQYLNTVNLIIASRIIMLLSQEMSSSDLKKVRIR